MAHLGKIIKDKDCAPSDLEEEVAKHLYDIESLQGSELKQDLKEFRITGVREFECPGGKKNQNTAVVIFVPFALHKDRKKIMARLIRELEKKMSKKYVLIV